MKAISRFRTELMGIAIIWVVCYHIFTQMKISIVPYVSSIGYCGVDIFLYLSGFGLCFGIGKYTSVLKFYQKRLLRIIPTYFCVITLSVMLSGSLTLFDIITKTLGIGYYLPIFGMSSFDWYIPTLYGLYLLFPLAYLLIHRNLKMGGVILIASCIPALLKLSGIDIPINNLTLSRFPIFIMGVISGNILMKNQQPSALLIKSWMVFSLVGLFIMLVLVNVYTHDFLWRTMLYWLPFALITPGLCHFLSRYLAFVPRNLRRILSFVGTISLEVYLIHISIIKDYSKCVMDRYGDAGAYEVWISGVLFLILSILLGYTLKYVLDRILCSVRNLSRIIGIHATLK